MNAKKPGEWTPDDIRALQRKYSRTHFTHFAPSPIKLKRAKRKMINGVLHMYVFKQWVPVPNSDRDAQRGRTKRRRNADDNPV